MYLHGIVYIYNTFFFYYILKYEFEYRNSTRVRIFFPFFPPRSRVITNLCFFISYNFRISTFFILPFECRALLRTKHASYYANAATSLKEVRFYRYHLWKEIAAKKFRDKRRISDRINLPIFQVACNNRNSNETFANRYYTVAHVCCASRRFFSTILDHFKLELFFFLSS